MLTASLLALSLAGGTHLYPPPVTPVQFGRFNPTRQRWRFGRSPGSVDPISPGGLEYGADLPIIYTLATDYPTGTKWYVEPAIADGGTGAGTACTLASPCASTQQAHTNASNGDVIVLGGGVYRNEFNRTFTKSITLVAATGEIPVFSGSVVVTGTFTNEVGAHSYVSYDDQPITNGSMSITTGVGVQGGMNGVGRFPDQAWIDNVLATQVTTKAAVTDGKFWVDSTNSRLYVTDADAAKPVEICPAGSSGNDDWAGFSGPIKLRGVILRRYCNDGSAFGVLDVNNTGDGSVLEDVVVEEPSLLGIALAGGSGTLLEDVTMTRVTITRAGWVGLSPNYVEDFVATSLNVTGSNWFDEFTNSPVSGGVKLAHTRRATIKESLIVDNDGVGIWWDQSNMESTTAKSIIGNNEGTQLFIEISDRALVIDNLIIGTAASTGLKGAGSGGLRLVNNTIIGGLDPIGIYSDARSVASTVFAKRCATTFTWVNSSAVEAACTGGTASSDRWTHDPVPATMDWQPRIDMMINNIVGYPSGQLYCESMVALCVETVHTNATFPLSAVFHAADGSRGIPQTLINGNVYANGTGTNIAVLEREGVSNSTHTAIGTLRTYLATLGSTGNEALGLSGNQYVNADGTPTFALETYAGSGCTGHACAVGVPTDAAINAYIAPNVKHFGVTWQ